MPSKEYYDLHREEVLASNRNWILENKERYKKYRKDYYEKNKKRLIQYTKKWNEDHPGAYAKRDKDKFKDVPWEKTYRLIEHRVKYKKGYVNHGIKNYITIQDLQFLWLRDKASLMVKPSIDRIDGFGDYTLENCRYIEYIENVTRPKCRYTRKNEQSS